MNGNDPCPRCGDVMVRHGAFGQSNLPCDFRDESDLTPQLVGLEGWRVEVRDIMASSTAAEFNAPAHSTECVSSQTRRFYVGRSTGWRPSHLEVNNRRSLGGAPAFKAYASVRRLYRR